jgi:hypothetical protein
MADQMMALIIPQFKQLVPGIPDAFWVRFREKFYESPMGKRMGEVTPLLTQETMAVGQKWGEKLGQDIVNELIKDGYVDL